MGRFQGGEDFDDDHWALTMGRWERNLRVCLAGKRGQKALREILEVLEGLPSKRLIGGWLATPDGEVCAVGALVAAKDAKAKGISITEAAAALAVEYVDDWSDLVWVGPGQYADQRYGNVSYLTPAQRERWWPAEDEDGTEHTVEAGTGVGLTQTLVWWLGDINDNECRAMTPEERYVHVLRRIRRKIAKAEGKA